MQSAVTALRYSSSGAQVASGSKDTDIIVWDVLGETGLFRLRGHKDQVTDLVSVCVGEEGHSSCASAHLATWPHGTYCSMWQMVQGRAARRLWVQCRQLCCEQLQRDATAAAAAAADMPALLLLQAWLNKLNRLVSCSKDGHLRVWELSLQHCSQVVAGFRGEVWSLDVDSAEERLAVGERRAAWLGELGLLPGCHRLLAWRVALLCCLLMWTCGCG